MVLIKCPKAKYDEAKQLWDKYAKDKPQYKNDTDKKKVPHTNVGVPRLEATVGSKLLREMKKLRRH
jgi:hypothetical protein